MTDDRGAVARRARWTARLLAVCLPVLAGCGGPGAADAGDAVDRPTVDTDTGLHERLPAEVREAGVLVIGTDATYAPATFFGPDGRTVVGFEADLGAALGQVLGVRVDFSVVEFEGLLGALGARDIDLVLSAMTDTAERQQQADFVNYFRAGTSVVVQRGNPSGVSELRDLCGEKVAVERGTVQVDLLERIQRHCPAGRPVQVQEQSTNADALVELRTGRVAAVLNDYPPAAYLTTDARTQADYQLASDTQYEPGLYGIAVAQERTQLREAVQAGLERLLADGVYVEVLTEWGVAEGALRTVSVNAGAPARD